MMLNKYQERILEHAILYALDRKWCVLPVSKGDKKQPLIKDWPNKASNDENQIVDWWTEFPNANIGIATGVRSNIFVIDVDIKENVNGLKTLESYFKDNFVFDITKYLVGRTPSGGVHFFFQWNDDFPVKSTSNVLPGVDTRGTGGQVVISPSSRNIDGEWKEYRLNDINLPVSPITPWAFDIIKLAGEQTGHKLDLATVIKGLTEGQRDEQIFKFAWLLRGHNISYELAVGFVTQAALHCIPPFDPEDAKRKVDEAYTTELETVESMNNTEKMKLIVQQLKNKHQ